MSADGATPEIAALESSRQRLELLLTGTVGVCIAAVVSVGLSFNASLQFALAVNVVLCIGGFFLTVACIQSMGIQFVKANLRGIDLNKSTTKRDKDGILVRPIDGISIPESQGTICATIFIAIMSVFIPSAFAAHGVEEFPHARLAEYLAAVLTITLASFLGLQTTCLI